MATLDCLEAGRFQRCVQRLYCGFLGRSSLVLVLQCFQFLFISSSTYNFAYTYSATVLLCRLKGALFYHVQNKRYRLLLFVLGCTKTGVRLCYLCARGLPASISSIRRYTYRGRALGNVAAICGALIGVEWYLSSMVISLTSVNHSIFVALHNHTLPSVSNVHSLCTDVPLPLVSPPSPNRLTIPENFSREIVAWQTLLIMHRVSLNRLTTSEDSSREIVACPTLLIMLRLVKILVKILVKYHQ